MYAGGSDKAREGEIPLQRSFLLFLVYICASSRKDSYSFSLRSPVALSYGRQFCLFCHTFLTYFLLLSRRLKTKPVVQSV